MSVDIDYAINTNGILLSGAAAEEIARGSKWTRISIDSGNAQQYKELHAGKDFYNKIINNAEAFNKIKIGTSGVSYIVMQDNIDGIVACTKLAKDIGCDFIQFKPIYELFFDGKRQQKVYQEELIRSVFIELEKAKELQTSDFAVLVTGSMDAVLKGKGNEQFKQYQTCYAQQLVTLINPINVFVCPNWRGSEDMGIGDINTHSFKEIWLSDRRKEVINNLNPSNDCNLQCLRHQINVVMDSLVRSKRMDFDILNLMETIEDNILVDSNFI
jgi:MoaA/NifB/PqqE/SkfB family radical SAM enzyme